MKLIECPRDAMQGLHDFIPTEKKAAYINALLKVGFDTIDFGSFVSPKAIPQLRDTADVLSKLDLDNTKSDLLAIIANTRGGNDAAQFDEIRYLGFPFSVSETFQQRNTNKSIEQSLHTVEDLVEIAAKHNKDLVVYLSMAFGNPYGDDWNVDIVAKWSERLANMGVKIQALSDTIGVSGPENISYLFHQLIPAFPEISFGAHLHTTPDTWKEKVVAAYDSGCRRFDSAIKGFGGCPMAKDDLVGNMPTEKLISFLSERKIDNSLHPLRFETAYNKALETFPI